MRAQILSKNYTQEIGVSISKITSEKDLSFYIKYANGRINSFKDLELEIETDFTVLTDIYSQSLLQKILEWPIVIKDINQSYDMHKLFNFTFILCQNIHSFLSNITVVSESNNPNKSIEAAKIKLLFKVQEILHIAAKIIGISLPFKI